MNYSNRKEIFSRRNRTKPTKNESDKLRKGGKRGWGLKGERIKKSEKGKRGREEGEGRGVERERRGERIWWGDHN